MGRINHSGHGGRQKAVIPHTNPLPVGEGEPYRGSGPNCSRALPHGRANVPASHYITLIGPDDQMIGIVIRPATNADCERVINLVSTVLAEFQLPFDPDSKDADLKDIECSYLAAGGMFELIEDAHGKLLGTYGLFPLDDKQCELRKMYFLPEIRGLGLGKQVLDRAIEHARRLGFSAIVLETISVLKRAIYLYTRFGFVPTKMDHPNARVDQKYI